MQPADHGALALLVCVFAAIAALISREFQVLKVEPYMVSRGRCRPHRRAAAAALAP